MNDCVAAAFITLDGMAASVYTDEEVMGKTAVIVYEVSASADMRGKDCEPGAAVESCARWMVGSGGYVRAVCVPMTAVSMFALGRASRWYSRRFVSEWRKRYGAEPEYEDVVRAACQVASMYMYWTVYLEGGFGSYSPASRFEEDRVVLGMCRRPKGNVENYVARLRADRKYFKENMREFAVYEDENN